MDVDLLAQMATETLVEDESLRGELTDWEYQPLLDWAIARVAHCAKQATQEKDPRAHLDACVAGLRRILRAAVQAVSEQDASPLVQTLSAPAVDPADLDVIQRRLTEVTLSDDNEMNARQIADALSVRQDR